MYLETKYISISIINSKFHVKEKSCALIKTEDLKKKRKTEKEKENKRGK